MAMDQFLLGLDGCDVPFHPSIHPSMMPHIPWSTLARLSGTQKPTASFGYLLCCFKSFGESAVQANEQMRPDVKRGEDRRACQIDRQGAQVLVSTCITSTKSWLNRYLGESEKKLTSERDR